MKNSFNRSQIAKVANQLVKLGFTLSQAFKMSWTLAKSENTLSVLINAISTFHGENLRLIAQVASGNFSFNAITKGGVREVKNAKVFGISVNRDLALFIERDENGNELLNEKGKPAIKSFKISHLIAA